jgi:threonine-phosphate decarboxylase
MALLEIAESKEGWVIADECFINLTYPRAFSCLPFIGGGRVIVLRAITKDFSAPGLRVGFAAASPDMTRLIRDKIQSWPINCVGESFAVACASRPEPFLSDSAKKISVERARLIRGLKTLGYYPYPSSVNFILAKSGRLSANGLYDKLKRKSFLVRRCSNFEGLDDWHFRIAVRGTEDNDAFLCALAEI